MIETTKVRITQNGRRLLHGFSTWALMFIIPELSNISPDYIILYYIIVYYCSESDLNSSQSQKIEMMVSYDARLPRVPFFKSSTRNPFHRSSSWCVKGLSWKPKNHKGNHTAKQSSRASSVDTSPIQKNRKLELQNATEPKLLQTWNHNGIIPWVYHLPP